MRSAELSPLLSDRHLQATGTIQTSRPSRAIASRDQLNSTASLPAVGDYVETCSAFSRSDPNSSAAGRARRRRRFNTRFNTAGLLRLRFPGRDDAGNLGVARKQEDGGFEKLVCLLRPAGMTQTPRCHAGRTPGWCRTGRARSPTAAPLPASPDGHGHSRHTRRGSGRPDPLEPCPALPPGQPPRPRHRPIEQHARLVLIDGRRLREFEPDLGPSASRFRPVLAPFGEPGVLNPQSEIVRKPA